MYRVLVAACLVFYAVLSTPTCGADTASSAADVTAAFTVFGYLPEYRLNGFNYKAAFDEGLTHLIYFSIEVDPKTHLPKALDRLPRKPDAKRAREAADAVGGKILISFGGNARSDGFAQMVQTEQTRKKFLMALETILNDYQFDGVDYNWEYPRNADEWRKWGLLLKESKEFLKGGDRARNVVTFTMYLDPNHYDVIKHFNLLEHADYVHCMAYDQHGQHSTYDFAVSGIQLAKEKQLPLKKYTLGVPFYARHVQTGEAKTYAELVPRMKPQDRYTTDKTGPFYLNSPAMLKRKVHLAANEGIGGIMIWELGQDVQPLNMPHSLMRDGVKRALDERRQRQQEAAGGGVPTYSRPATADEL